MSNDIVTIICRPLFLTNNTYTHTHKLLVSHYYVPACYDYYYYYFYILHFVPRTLPARGDRTRTQRVRECISYECIREVKSSQSDVERRRRQNALRNSADKCVAIYGRPYYTCAVRCTVLTRLQF